MLGTSGEQSATLEGIVAIAKSRFRCLLPSDAFTQLGLADFAWRHLRARACQPLSADTAHDKMGPPIRNDPPTRTELILALASKLESIRLPAVWVSTVERKRGWATRLLARPGCPVCGGSGTISCPDCRGQVSPGSSACPGPEPEALDQAASCATCGGLGRVRCGCAGQVRYSIERGTANGAIVTGTCGASDRPYFARVYSARAAGRPPTAVRAMGSLPVLVIGLLSCVVGVATLAVLLAEPTPLVELAIFSVLTVGAVSLPVASALCRAGRKSGWALTHLPWVALLVGGMALLAVAFVWVAQAGLALEGVVAWLLASSIVVAPVTFLRHWHHPSIVGYFRAGHDASRSQLYLLLPLRDRLALLLRSRLFLRRLGFLILLALLLAGVRAALGPHRLIIRALVAEKTGGLGAAIWLYETAATRPISPRLKPAAVERGYKLRLLRAERSFAGGGSEDDYSAAIKDLLVISSAGPDVPPRVKQRAPSLIWQAIGVLVKRKKWAEARQLSKVLAGRYPDGEETRTLFDESRWEFDQVQAAIAADREPVALKDKGTAHLEDGKWWVDNDTSNYDYSKPRDGCCYAEVQLRLAHLGRTKKELWATQFSALDPQGQAHPCTGIKAAISPYPGQKMAHDGSPVSARLLCQVQEFPGISVGPDVCEIVLVFEVPREHRHLKLLVLDRVLCEVDIG